MRVIAGSARRLRLQSVEGLDTRPTSDRIKETLFNMIGPGMDGIYFLDLFAGSGQIGLEALSRGASYAVFVDSSRRAGACIRENIEVTHFGQVSRLFVAEALTALRRMEGMYTFQYIFMDPPYGKQYEKDALMYLSGSALLDEDAVIIIEAARQEDFSYVSEMGFFVEKEKVYKTNKHVFLTKEI